MVAVEERRMSIPPRVRVALFMVVCALAPAAAAAHVRWFVSDPQFAPDWGLLLRWPTLLVVAAAAVLYAVLRVVQRLAGTPHFPNPPFLKYMEPSATALLAVQTGISLVYAASQRTLFAPNLKLSESAAGWMLVLLQIAVAFTFITGLFDRAGALLIIVVYLLGFLVFPPVMVLEQTLYVGIGVALFVLGRTIPPPEIARRLLPLSDYDRHAVAALRILTGCSVLLLGFTEKLLAPERGLEFLRDHPDFNVARQFLGMDWFTDGRLVTAAGVTEAVIGILLIAGLLPRVVILLMWVPFNATVSFLPPVELLGHLPIFGVMYVLLLYGSGVAPGTRVQLQSAAARAP
jgi:uncharacterized membrane protein YphA (DoxX/SURF4 family)